MNPIVHQFQEYCIRADRRFLYHKSGFAVPIPGSVIAAAEWIDQFIFVILHDHRVLAYGCSKWLEIPHASQWRFTTIQPDRFFPVFANSTHKFRLEGDHFVPHGVFYPTVFHRASSNTISIVDTNNQRYEVCLDSMIDFDVPVTDQLHPVGGSSLIVKLP